MGLHLKGNGQFAVQLWTEIPYSPAVITNSILYEVVIDFNMGRLDFHNFIDNDFVSKLIPGGLSITENTLTSYWFEMQCTKTKSKQTIRYNCSICFGKSGLNETLLEIYIGNPFKELHRQPTYVSFVPKTKETTIKLSFDCSISHGAICAHTDECKKVDKNLVCSNLSKFHNQAGINGIRTFEEDRCTCRTDMMKWRPDQRKCVHY